MAQLPLSPVRDPVSGRIVPAHSKLDEGGDVLDLQIDCPSSRVSLFAPGEVKSCRFTPPTQNGQPVKAKARLPIPITIT